MPPTATPTLFARFLQIPKTVYGLWMLWAGGCMFLWPQCLDWQLVPRFLWIALSLLAGGAMLWQTFRQRGDWRLSGVMAVLWVWYALNLASVTWAFRVSEAVFYSQKVFLFTAAIWFFYQCLFTEEVRARQSLYQATLWVTVASMVILVRETLPVLLRHGPDNQMLYDAVHLLSGNKSLSSDFLFFLGILHGVFYREQPRRWIFWSVTAALLVLILLLQTRTVYIATLGAAGCVVLLNGWTRSLARHRSVVVVASAVLLVALGLFRGVQQAGGTLAERLDPRTWLESTSASERRFVWYKTDLLNREHYWQGVGNGSWKICWPSNNVQGGYRLEELQVSFTRAHNDYLEIRAELGMTGVLLFCFWYILMIFLNLLVWKKTKKSDQRREVAFLTGGFVGYAIIQYFDFPRERMEMQLWLALLCALTLRAFYVVSDEDKSVAKPVSGKNCHIAWRNVFGLFLLAGLCLSAWVGMLRMQGERYCYRMYEALEAKNHQGVIGAVTKARNRFFEYDDVVIPLSWHEGNAWAALHRFDKALPCFENALQLNPWSYHVINHYANALVETAPPGDTTHLRQAVRLYETAVALNPRHNDSKFNLAYVFLKLNDPDSALQWVEKVDTIARPRTPEQRQQNRSLLEKKASYRKKADALARRDAQ